MGNSSVSPALLEEKHVVIIGGGYGGIALASSLQKHEIPFTLIDPKDCFHHNVAACRAGVFPGKYFQTLGMLLHIYRYLGIIFTCAETAVSDVYYALHIISLLTYVDLVQKIL